MKSIDEQTKDFSSQGVWQCPDSFREGAEFIERRIKIQISEWQKRWQDLQELIEDKIESKDYSGAFRMQTVATTLKSCIKDAYKIIGSDDIQDS